MASINQSQDGLNSLSETQTEALTDLLAEINEENPTELDVSQGAVTGMLYVERGRQDGFLRCELTPNGLEAKTIADPDETLEQLAHIKPDVDGGLSSFPE